MGNKSVCLIGCIPNMVISVNDANDEDDVKTIEHEAARSRSR